MYDLLNVSIVTLQAFSVYVTSTITYISTDSEPWRHEMIYHALNLATDVLNFTAFECMY